MARRLSGTDKKRAGQRGATLVMVAIAMVMILGAAALSIDLTALYLQKSEAQRAADSGAMAGAMAFTQGCSLDASCLSANVEASATAQATQAVQKNLVFGQIPTVSSTSFTAGGGSTADPLITVNIQAPAKTFFLPLSDRSS